MTKNISVAYSPDTDDAFMVYAMKEKLVDLDGFKFEFFKDDIQTLNQSAMDNRYDVCAISMAAYPKIADDYILMPIGASVGDDFGPAIVAHAKSGFSDTSEFKGRRIAVPGLETTAFYAAYDLFGPFEPVPMRFDKIEEAIKNKEVDGGILIHEPQLVCDDPEIHKLADLGKLWYKKYQLPLPLGGNAIKRSLGKEVIDQITTVYRNSICYGLEHREETIKKASASAVVSLDYELADKYIDQYVNHRSIEIQKDVLEGIIKLLELGAEHGLCKNVLDTEFIYT